MLYYLIICHSCLICYICCCLKPKEYSCRIKETSWWGATSAETTGKKRRTAVVETPPIPPTQLNNDEEEEEEEEDVIIVQAICFIYYRVTCLSLRWTWMLKLQRTCKRRYVIYVHVYVFHVT